MSMLRLSQCEEEKLTDGSVCISNNLSVKEDEVSKMGVEERKERKVRARRRTRLTVNPPAGVKQR